MRGFQPATQNFADGGVVARIKGVFGLGEKKPKPEEQTAAPAPAPTPTPAPSEEPKTAIGQYASGSALKRRMAEVDGYANGGPVRGKGTGTSDEVPDVVPEGTYIMPTDSTQAIGEQKLAAMGQGGKVPVNLSNGEFKMPPEQVHAIGVQALDQMKGATHTPVAPRGFQPGAQQEAEPPMFFADGGVVDEKKKPNFPSPTNIWPGSTSPGTSGSTSAAPPIAEPVSAAAATQGRQSEALQTQLQGLPAPQFQRDLVQRQALESQIQRAQANERYESADAQMAAEAREAATMRMNRSANRPLASPVVAPSAGEAALAVHDAGSAVGAGRGSVNPPLAAPNSPVTAGPVATPSAPLAAASTVGAGRGSINPPMADPAAPRPTSVTPTATEVLPGVFRSGSSYADSASNAVAGLQARGLPSAKNDAAAEALAQQSAQASMSRVTALQPPQPGWSGVIGQDPAAIRERKALMDALTSPVAGARGLTAAQRNGVLSLMNQESQAQQAKDRNATSIQQTEMQGATQRDMTAMREAGDNGRAALREAGETSRSGARNAIDQGRLSLDQQVRGFDIRAGQRQEKLYERYAAADTPDKKAAIAQEIRDLSGKQAESPWKIQVTQATKNTDGSTNDGSIYRYNTQTGAVERADVGGAAAKTGPVAPKSRAEYDALPKGAQYIKDGKVLVKN